MSSTAHEGCISWGDPGYVDQDGVDCPSCGRPASGLDVFRGGLCTVCGASWCSCGVLH